MVAIEPKQGIAFAMVWNCAKAQCHLIQIIGGAEALN
jgi:hypothetical protein